MVVFGILMENFRVELICLFVSLLFYILQVEAFKINAIRFLRFHNNQVFFIFSNAAALFINFG